jgi:transglutaminase-like putative cysteine protease
MQSILNHSLTHSVYGPSKEYEDVFGNSSTYVELSAAYQELAIRAQSTIRVVESPPLAGRSTARRDGLPLVWMPWQRQMMSPYLLPPELPESELQEINEFAISIAARNDNDLYSTFLDLNATIYRDFAYVSGSTTLETTPYDVFVNRRGVCQDFANLMICMARLLNVPARYRVGYIFTGAQYENKVQSEASHAWVELYLPWNGWRGFDPTNGCIAGVDHVRVACGRNYRDATPTTGTIYKGQPGTETLTVEVRVEEIFDAPQMQN